MSVEETMDRRVKKAVEQILDAEALTSGLEDGPAKVLINWGVAQVEQKARQTAHIQNDDEAGEVVNQAVSRIRRVMKRVAKAAEADGVTAPEDLNRMLAQKMSEVAAEAAAEAAATRAPAPPAVEPPPPAPRVAEPAPPKPPVVEAPPSPEPRDEGLVARFFRALGFGGK